SPSDMLAGLGLVTAGQPVIPNVMNGDLAITNPAALLPAVVEGDDQTFQNALLTLGLDGWPIVEAPRLSRMWLEIADGSWRFAGLMIESPEPIHRPGRFELDGLSLDMGNAGAAIRFDLRRRDRAGARLIYLTATPFAVVTRERIIFGHWPFQFQPDDRFPRFRSITPKLVLKGKSMLMGAGADLSGELVIPMAPGFAEDP